MSTQETKELKAQRDFLVSCISDMDSVASKVEIYEMLGEISEIDQKIHAIDPSQV